MNSPSPFYYMVPTEEDGETSYEIRYALHASSLMTVAMDSDGPVEDKENSLYDGGKSKSSSQIEKSSSDDVVVIVDSDEDDDVIFVSSFVSSSPNLQKPFNIVKPFEVTTTNDNNSDAASDEIVNVEDDEEDCGGQFDEESVTSNDFEIHHLYDESEDPLRLENAVVRLKMVSDNTLHNYSHGKTHKKLSLDMTWSSKPSSVGAFRRKRRSSDDQETDPTFIPDELMKAGLTKDLTVYQNVPLNKIDRNRSRTTFCNRVFHFMEQKRENAAEVVRAFWDMQSTRTKRKYLPRSKNNQSVYGVDESDVQIFSSDT